MMRDGVVVIHPGFATTVQDTGRSGWGHLGVPRAGAADRRSAALAHRLVGNPPDAALLETSGNLVIRAVRDGWCAVTGADAALSIDGRPCDLGRSVFIPAGSELRLGTPRRGLRNYLAIDGGIAGHPVLGSLSTDTLSNIIPVPVYVGSVLGTGPVGDGPVFTDPLPARRMTTFDISPGPRDAWCTPQSLSRLVTDEWIVDDAVDRIGIRLHGPTMVRAVEGEVPSEGLVRGAVQMLPSGGVIVMLADHPVTGGYPVVAVVTSDAMDDLSQCRPGERVHFRWSRGDDVAG